MRRAKEEGRKRVARRVHREVATTRGLRPGERIRSEERQLRRGVEVVSARTERQESLMDVETAGETAVAGVATVARVENEVGGAPNGITCGGTLREESELALQKVHAVEEGGQLETKLEKAVSQREGVLFVGEEHEGRGVRRRHVGIASKLNRTDRTGEGSRVSVKNARSIRREIGYQTPIQRPRTRIKHLFILNEDFSTATVYS